MKHVLRNDKLSACTMKQPQITLFFFVVGPRITLQIARGQHRIRPLSACTETQNTWERKTAGKLHGINAVPPLRAKIYISKDAVTLLLTCRIRVHFYETYNCLWEVRRPATGRDKSVLTTPLVDLEWKNSLLDPPSLFSDWLADMSFK